MHQRRVTGCRKRAALGHSLRLQKGGCIGPSRRGIVCKINHRVQAAGLTLRPQGLNGLHFFQRAARGKSSQCGVAKFHTYNSRFRV